MDPCVQRIPIKNQHELPVVLWKVASDHICDRVSESMLHIAHIQCMLHIVHHHSRRFSAKIRSAITLYYDHYHY